MNTAGADRSWGWRRSLAAACAGALFASGASVALGQGDDESVLRAVRAQLELLVSIPKEFDADYRTYFPAGGMLTDEEKRRTFQPEETINSALTHLRQESDRYYCTTEQHYWWPESESNPQTTWVAFDGKDERRLTIGRNQKGGVIANQAPGKVAVLETMSETGTFSRGILLGYSLLDALNDSSAVIAVEPELSKIEDEDCYVIKITDGTATSTVWIDPARGYNVRQWEIQFKAKDYFSLNDVAPFRVFDIQCEQVDGVWFPVGAKLSHAHTPDDAPAEPLWTGQLIVRNLKLNGQFTAADFAFDFPPGADFRDARTDARFKVTPQGDVTPDLGFLRETTGAPAEVMTALSEEINQQVAEVNRIARPEVEKKLVARENRTWVRYLWLPVGAIAVFLATIVWRRRRRS